MMKKAQAAMEFLMTYGWAILVVLLAVGALAYFGVLSPSQLLPEQTTFTAPMPSVANAVIDAQDNSVEIAFKNNLGRPITLPLDGNVTAGGSTTCDFDQMNATYRSGSNNVDIVADTTSIPNGATFLINWDCEDLPETPESGTRFEADMLFYYTNSDTGQVIPHTGSVSAKYP